LALQITKQMTKQKQDKKSKIKARAPPTQLAGYSAAGPRALPRLLRSAAPALGLRRSVLTAVARCRLSSRL
jgi:hypothetical protein